MKWNTFGLKGMRKEDTLDRVVSNIYFLEVNIGVDLIPKSHLIRRSMNLSTKHVRPATLTDPTLVLNVSFHVATLKSLTSNFLVSLTEAPLWWLRKIG